MNKDFASSDLVRNNALKLANRIYADGFMPSIIYVSLRGGAFLGNVFSEYFKLVNTGGKPVFYAAVVAHSYIDLQQKGRVRIDGWTYDPEYLRSGDKVLLIDDIFDTGRTINYLVECIMEKGVPREDIKIAVHDYKRTPEGNKMLVHPDYWCREMSMDDKWIHYMSHELEGLTDWEIEEHYLSKYPELAEVFDRINRIRSS